MRPLLLSLLLVGCATTSTSTTGSSAPTPVKDTASTEPAATKALFERLGGKSAIEAVIDDFLGRVAGDESINSGFAVGHVPRLRQRLVELV